MKNKADNLTISLLMQTQVTRYAFVGILIAIISILAATLIVSYQMTGQISWRGLYLAQTTNPAIWALDITPFIFAYWGQSFFFSLSDKAKNYLQYKEQEFRNENTNMKLQYYYESNHDKLTKLPNSLLFNEKTKQAILRMNDGQKLAVTIIKIKNFPQLLTHLNAHEIDELLQQAAERLKIMLLEPFMLEINRDLCFLARTQADEFALLLPHLNEKKSLGETIKMISQYMSIDLIVNGNQQHINMITGASIYPDHSEDVEELIRQAQSATYYADSNNLSYTIYNS